MNIDDNDEDDRVIEISEEIEQSELVVGQNLPQLGLSHRRGQRHSQTGRMVEFLTNFDGFPWDQVQICLDLLREQSDEPVRESKTDR